MNENIRDNEARVNITYGGLNGDLPDPVIFDATDGDVKTWVTEAVRNGSIPGIPADAGADFHDFVVDRFRAKPEGERGANERPYNAIFVRPKTPFGLI